MDTRLDVLVTGHGPLPHALVESARMIGGELPNVRAIGLEPGESPVDFAARLRTVIDDAMPAVVLSDLAGGTPHNTVRLVLREHPGIALVSSVSLPLLLEFALSSDIPEDIEAVCSATNPRITVSQQ